MEKWSSVQVKVSIPSEAVCPTAEAHTFSNGLVEIVTLWSVLMPKGPGLLPWHNEGIESPQSLRPGALRTCQGPGEQELSTCHEGAESRGLSPWEHHQKKLFRAKCIPCVDSAHVFLVSEADLPGFGRVSV